MDSIDTTISNQVKNLESAVNELITSNEMLKKDNRLLKSLKNKMHDERLATLKANDKARQKISETLKRLRDMEYSND
ncbi:MAG: hypothetical protein DRQ51_05975 [Gammaproteobacteria bacterium]|nr:MAG: hypothetical protein DRQ51_05975 [Gammaproteobacteria bacterium]